MTDDRWMDVSRRYFEAFGDGFPTMMFGGSTEEAIEVMERCIEENEPYEPEEGFIY